MDNQDLAKIFDRRTPYKAGKNYEISKHNEAEAMFGLTVVMQLNRAIEQVVSEKIDSDESWIDGKLHVKPDFYVYAQYRDGVQKKWTIEVKTTQFDNFLNEEIIIKAPQVWTCKNNPSEYPLPYILAATSTQFALIPMGSFWNSPVLEIDFGDFKKKGYILNCGDYKWNNFVSPLKFRTNNDK